MSSSGAHVKTEDAFITAARATLQTLSPGVELRKYQKDGVFGFILPHERNGRGGILCDEMGLGKTWQIAASFMCNPMGRTLVLVPVAILSQWEEALRRFGLTVITVTNADTNFTQMGPSTQTKVFLATHSCLLKSEMHEFFCIPWDRVVVDEAHVLRNPEARMHANAMLLNAKIRWALTATPIQNQIDDLVSLALFVGAPHPQNTTEVCNLYVLRRTMQELEAQGEAFNIPELISRYQIFTLTKKETELYNTVSVKCTSAMTRMMRQRMACVHPGLAVKSLTKGRVCPEVVGSKISWLTTDIVQHQNTKNLVFCTWTPEIALIQATLTNAGMRVLVFDGSLDAVGREAVLNNFKLPEFNVLILQITCGSVGLNLQQATRVYIMSPSWNPTVEMQAIARTHRQGQTQQVTCTRLIARNTVEERCTMLQYQKAGLIDAATKDNMVRKRLLLHSDDLGFLAGNKGIAGYEELMDENSMARPKEKSMVPRKRRVLVVSDGEEENVKEVLNTSDPLLATVEPGMVAQSTPRCPSEPQLGLELPSEPVSVLQHAIESITAASSEGLKRARHGSRAKGRVNAVTESALDKSIRMAMSF